MTGGLSTFGEGGKALAKEAATSMLPPLEPWMNGSPNDSTGFKVFQTVAPFLGVQTPRSYFSTAQRKEADRLYRARDKIMGQVSSGWDVKRALEAARDEGIMLDDEFTDEVERRFRESRERRGLNIRTRETLRGARQPELLEYRSE